MEKKLMKIRNQINMAILSSLGFIGMAVAADQAQIATLIRVDGVAVASQDGKYVGAREGMTLKEGDRLMVLEGGSAILAFADGCQYELGEMAMLAVQGTSTCAAKGVGVYKVDPKSGVADGAIPKAQLAALGPQSVFQNQLIWLDNTPNPYLFPLPSEPLPWTFTPLSPVINPWWWFGATAIFSTTIVALTVNNTNNNNPPPPVSQ
jgi:hypothetical protein